MADQVLAGVFGSAKTLGGALAGAVSTTATAATAATAAGTLATLSATLPLSFLVVSSVLPVVKVLLIAATGLVFALPYFDVLHEDARKSLSKLVFTVFLPAIIFVNLGEAISLEHLIQWWFIPVNVILASVIGCMVGMLVAWLTDCPPEFFRVVFVLTGIGNMGNMPLVLLSAVCSDVRNPFGGPHECNKLGTAYISLGMWMAAIIMWAVVYNILSPPEEWLPGYMRPPHEAHPIDQKYVHSPMVPYVAPPDMDADGDSHMDLLAAAAAAEAAAAAAGGSSGDGEGSMRGGDWSVRGGYMVHRRTGIIRKIERGVRRASVAVLVTAPNKCGDILRVLHIYDIFRPPVLAAFLAMLFGMIPPVDYAFFDRNGPLRFLSDAMAVLGQAMIPCILLVLGANLVKGPGASRLPARTTTAVVVARLVLMPAVGIVVVLTADRLGFLPPDDKMFRFVLLVQHAMPSSIQIGTACSLRGFGEKEVSAVLFFQHISAIISMACSLFIFFYILYG